MVATILLIREVGVFRAIFPQGVNAPDSATRSRPPHHCSVRPSLKSIPVARCAVERGRQICPLAIQKQEIDAKISIVLLLRDWVAPAGRDKPVVRVVHPERGSRTAYHATGFILTTVGLLDAFDKNAVIWRVLRELSTILFAQSCTALVSALYVLEPFLY